MVKCTCYFLRSFTLERLWHGFLRDYDSKIRLYDSNGSNGGPSPRDGTRMVEEIHGTVGMNFKMLGTSLNLTMGIRIRFWYIGFFYV